MAQGRREGWRRWSSAMIGTPCRSSIGPVSSPASICMIVMPVSESPARMAACIGAAPRQRGNRLAWMLRQPRAGEVQHRLRQDQAIGGDHGSVQTECGELGLRSGVAAQAGRGANRQSQFIRDDMHRAATDCLASTSGSGWLAINRCDDVPVLMERP